MNCLQFFRGDGWKSAGQAGRGSGAFTLVELPFDGLGTVRKCKGTAFTLVELLVVVAIIALLISILLPSLTRAKEQARIVVCLSNQRGLGLAFVQYASDADDRYPAGAGWGGDPPTWDARMLDFYENKALLLCPSDNLPREEWYNRRGVGPDRRFPRSYAINIQISYRGDSVYGATYPNGSGNNPYNGDSRFPWPGWGVHKTAQIKIPAQTILLGEVWDWPYYANYSDIVPNSYNQYPGCYVVYDSYWQVTFYHRDRNYANFLFCDGHAGPLREDNPNITEENDYHYYKRRKD